ncbi:hypothetical protein GY45DRAFT_653322 [Cubamyces sp. BRFM 1775]|nr:hypothetical protein GY45DRAFT_653322 [Cubamyces sp. BRFM 1775]
MSGSSKKQRQMIGNREEASKATPQRESAWKVKAVSYSFLSVRMLAIAKMMTRTAQHLVLGGAAVAATAVATLVAAVATAVAATLLEASLAAVAACEEVVSMHVRCPGPATNRNLDRSH